MKIQIVFAYGMSRSQHAPFGNKQSLPWKHNSTDLKHFKRVTDGTILLMGSKTFESLPGKLPNRPHVVLSSKCPDDQSRAKNGEFADFYVDGTMDEVIKIVKANYYGKYDTISVIGGPSVIMSAIKHADVVYTSTILEPNLECDVTIDIIEIMMGFPHRTDYGGGDNVVFEKLTKTE